MNNKCKYYQLNKDIKRCEVGLSRAEICEGNKCNCVNREVTSIGDIDE